MYNIQETSNIVNTEKRETEHTKQIHFDVLRSNKEVEPFFQNHILHFSKIVAGKTLHSICQ